MAESEDIPEIDNDEPEETPGYKAPAPKSVKEIEELDQDDESLVKYKQTLLAGMEEGAAPKDDQRRVVVQKMIFMSDGQTDIEKDLTGNLEALKKQVITIKEGVEYRLKIIFKVQHEIVAGLKYHHVISRKGVRGRNMAESEDIPEIDNDEPEETPGYKAPAPKSVKEIEELDQDDESLVKYKQTLLAGMEEGAAPKDDQRRVVVQKMIFMSDGQTDIEKDLTGNLEALKKQVITIKEGVEYRLKIIFKVQHEIVAGLKYHHVISRKGVRVAKQNYMVGSYGPKADPHSYTTPVDEAPKGMLARGSYKVKSKFLDDDKNVHLEWDWSFDIKKDWD
ncbi:rho GDP-dissociation inhibitor 1-like [Rhopilema esculentum]|uniref:rho GDP-dissociation inhibitor 1-like n=1 Tax=Rhopilema esculentum TaxID=499914 RepID=UPI0031DA0362